MTKFLTVVPIVMLMALSGCSKADSKSAVIRGNANGLWSPTHPHLTSGKSKPNSPVLYVPPPPVVEPVEVVEVAQVSDVCPTIQSAPHLCQDL